MSEFAFEPEAIRQGSRRRVTLDLTVKNHPGVMSHICGLFSKRAYNVEGVVCMPIGKGEHSRIWLLVDEDQRLDQIVKQVQKLQDVLDVKCRNIDRHAIKRLGEFMR